MRISKVLCASYFSDEKWKGTKIRKYSKKDTAKLERYRRILIKMLNKYWDSKVEEHWLRRLFKHQEVRIWRMIHKEFPDIVILDGHYND